MRTQTRLRSILGLIVLTLLFTACKPRMVAGPEQTFTVEVPRPATSSGMDVTMDLAVPQGTLALSGGAEGLIQGAITYNAAEYAPQMTNIDGVLLIKQTEPGPKSIIVSVQKDLINRWDLRLGDAPMNLEIHLKNGGYTIEFDKSLPAHFKAIINAGVGMLGIIIDPDLPAQIMIGEHTELLDIKTHGDWTQTGEIYETGVGSAALTITVNMSGGELTLDSEQKE